MSKASRCSQGVGCRTHLRVVELSTTLLQGLRVPYRYERDPHSYRDDRKRPVDRTLARVRRSAQDSLRDRSLLDAEIRRRAAACLAQRPGSAASVSRPWG
jgi:hypothetical protein